MKKRIIDRRIKEKYLKDDAYLNGQARLCGWQATLVYDSLCRHANIGQESYPSVQLMANELAVSKNTIRKGIENLEKFNVIAIKKSQTKKGEWLNNIYTLLDKSEWKKEGGVVPHKDYGGSPPQGLRSPSQGLRVVPHKDTKETHKKETHIRIATAYAVADINPIIAIFAKNLNPTLNYGNLTQRKAIATLIEKIGLERTIAAAKYAVSIQAERYAPTITTPVQLLNKYGELQAYWAKQAKSFNQKKGIIL